MKQNNPCYQFGMYEPNTDFVIVNNGKNTILLIHCKGCNSFVLFDDPNDIVYLYRLAEEAPLLYAKLALKKNGLQDYVDAMNWFNQPYHQSLLETDDDLHQQIKHYLIMSPTWKMI